MISDWRAALDNSTLAPTLEHTDEGWTSRGSAGTAKK